MSEEDENNSAGEENEEEEDEEGEENEDEEGEENEDEEGEEEEDDEENEEDEDENKEEGNKKEKGKNASQTKFDDNKLIQANEIKIDLPNGTEETFTMANIKHPKSIFAILDEINSEMDTLSKKLNSTLSFIESKFIEKENYDLQQVLNKADQLTKEIELMESLDKRTENKCIQSDQEDIYYHNTSHHSSPRNSLGNEMPVNNVPVVPMAQQYPYYPSYPQNEVYSPYDPNRNLHYYNSLRNNNNNFGRFNNDVNQMNYRDGYQTTRVRRMDELYQGRGFGMNNMNRLPVIYSQNENNQMDNRQYFNELNRSFTRQKEFGTGTDNITNNNYNINNYGGRPFERNRPGNISQAMDILLDK